MSIKFALAGCGHIAKRHAEHIHNHPEAELVAVFDTKSDRTKSLAEAHNCKAANSLEDLLAQDFDILNICAPNGNHAEIAMAALKAGKHVLVEKPMALNIEDAEKMIDLSMRHGRQLFVVKQNRFNPPVKAVKELLEEGKLGQIYAVQVNCFWNRNEQYYKQSDWKGTKALDGGTLYTQFSHFVDIFYYLFGDIDNISGIVSNVNHADMIDFEDTGFFNFAFKNGGIGSFNYTTSCHLKNMEGSITVFAENATIKIGGQYLNTIDFQRCTGFEIPELEQSGTANDYGFYQGSMSNHDKLIANVVDALKGRQPIMTNAMEGLKVVDIIQRMYNAARWV